MSSKVEQWGVFEVELGGPSEGNPFVDVKLTAEFECGSKQVKVPGFYDGEGIYRVRFMPEEQGEWTYSTRSNAAELDNQRGAFICTAPTAANHGPVRVRDTFHFAYADGTPYFSFGTTCYAWAHQGDALEEQTLETLKTASFNKMRMCVFPKDYIFNKNEPVHYPFVKDAAGASDFWRYDLAFFRHFENGLPEEGRYEVDVIDTWNMTVEKLDGVFEGKGELELPGRPHLAIRVRPVD